MNLIEYNLAVINKVTEKMEFTVDLDFITQALESYEDSDKFVRAVNDGESADTQHFLDRAIAGYKRRLEHV